ncbi:MAG: DsbA family protein [bacterium]|nr:DsbA family protein [bacterium]
MMYTYVGGEVTTDTTKTAKVAGVDDTVDPTPTPSAAPTPTVADVEVRADDYIRGDKNAPVTLVEWSDFECPFCSRVLPSLEKVLEDYDGQVRLIYRHFPLSFHANAQKAAEASECAGDQGKFWEMHDIMFENQSSIAVDDLKGYAKELGLNTSTFNDCLDNDTHAQKVKDDFTEGTQVGVQGTPATFVNGTMISGAQPYESFAAAIDAALAE